MFSDNQILLQINVTGDANTVVTQLAKNISELDGVSAKVTKKMQRSWDENLIVFNQIVQSFQNITQALNSVNAPAVAFDKSLQELSAITGVSGTGLSEIGDMAQDVAKKFGTDAAQGVESFKLLLSQLTPELGRTPEVMKKMGEDIAILSKTMGGDTTAAAEVLTTAMNQFQVSMDDPIAAEKEMARMMNVMAAAAKEGSAELPQIQEALKQAGMAAKTAGISFEETNAAIQVLDKAGRKGSEGGVALRNVMTTLAAGRFLPKDVKEELQGAGINIDVLTDRSKSLQERLQTLKPVMNDQALLTKLFGRENSAAAIALISGTEAMDDYTRAISGTNTAVEQADTIMQSYEERHKRLQAQIEGLKLRLFDVSGGMTMYVQTFGQMLIPLAQMIPLITGVGKTMMMVKNIQWASMWKKIGTAIGDARFGLIVLNAQLKSGKFASAGFLVNILRMTLALKRFALVGVFQAIKGLAALALSFITTGKASIFLRASALKSFAAVKISAISLCRSIGVAIMNIPIIGWIAAAIAALAALFAYFWKTSAKFRAVVKGSWAFVVSIIKEAWAAIKTIFLTLAKMIKAAITLDFSGVVSAAKGFVDHFRNFGKQSAQAYNEAYDEEMAKSQKKEAKEKKEAKAQSNVKNINKEIATERTAAGSGLTGGGNYGGSYTESGRGSSGRGGTDNRSITTNITNLIGGDIVINTTTIKESAAQIKRMIIEALQEATNEAAYI